METLRDFIVLGGVAGAVGAVVVAVIGAATQGHQQRRQIAATLHLEQRKAEIAKLAQERQRAHEARLREQQAIADAGAWAIPYTGQSLYWAQVAQAEYFDADVSSSRQELAGFPILSSPEQVMRAMFRIATEHPYAHIRDHALPIFEGMTLTFGPRSEERASFQNSLNKSKLDDWADRLKILLGELHRVSGNQRVS